MCDEEHVAGKVVMLKALELQMLLSELFFA